MVLVPVDTEEGNVVRTINIDVDKKPEECFLILRPYVFGEDIGRWVFDYIADMYMYVIRSKKMYMEPFNSEEFYFIKHDFDKVVNVHEDEDNEIYRTYMKYRGKECFFEARGVFGIGYVFNMQQFPDINNFLKNYVLGTEVASYFEDNDIKYDIKERKLKKFASTFFA